MKRVLVSILQLILVGGLFASFFALTPWLGCKPLAELPSASAASSTVPADAQCFTDNHGQIAFHAHGLISEEPVRFAIHVAALLALFGLLLLSFWKVGALGSRSRGTVSDGAAKS
jgi:hypothetical protein